ncbi:MULTISPECIES: CRISPR-associated protein Cas4 [unclassified Ruminococcus]|uniref:CRISPR-associated protein Cas4 n=1 Tax=unclassified Ruminococcus TaxID=2608920 RepID=UPI00210F1A70|nr:MULTISPECIES: CRISPR-associated protein Cas4 [unclassified Ruminococcus]MCQ4023335.1 CRISPR-associated protein Cas4 [Ruminococcus sp. zg-924]MCQ4115702.1 CRISPR-associated protein Cas4 [Ruminococcus sp. zg-921]
MSEKTVSGMQIYYYFVCRKKLWYYSNEINMESENENVQLGKIIDETTYKSRKKHIMIDNTINIDYITEHNVLHEVKKSRKIEEAGIWQIKYYLYYLKQRGVINLTGRIDYPLLKQSITVELTEKDEKKLSEVIKNIERLISSELPPKCEIKRFCKSCAYYDLCWI